MLLKKKKTYIKQIYNYVSTQFDIFHNSFIIPMLGSLRSLLYSEILVEWHPTSDFILSKRNHFLQFI